MLFHSLQKAVPCIFTLLFNDPVVSLLDAASSLARTLDKPLKFSVHAFRLSQKQHMVIDNSTEYETGGHRKAWSQNLTGAVPKLKCNKRKFRSSGISMLFKSQKALLRTHICNIVYPYVAILLPSEPRLPARLFSSHRSMPTENRPTFQRVSPHCLKCFQIDDPEPRLMCAHSKRKKK